MVAMVKGAEMSEDELYRYRLWREWDPGLEKLLVIGLNPSTADAELDDPTIRRCLGFARSWGYGGLEMVNLFAYRETDPKKMLVSDDPVGPLNDKALRDQVLADGVGRVMAAWGCPCHPLVERRVDYAIRLLLVDIPLWTFRLTKRGHPGHPLYVPAAQEPVVWRA